MTAAIPTILPAAPGCCPGRSPFSGPVYRIPTKQERERIARRLNLLNEEEMNNLYKNFTLMGIDTILEYLCGHYC